MEPGGICSAVGPHFACPSAAAKHGSSQGPPPVVAQKSNKSARPSNIQATQKELSASHHTPAVHRGNGSNAIQRAALARSFPISWSRLELRRTVSNKCASPTAIATRESRSWHPGDRHFLRLRCSLLQALYPHIGAQTLLCPCVCAQSAVPLTGHGSTSKPWPVSENMTSTHQAFGRGSSRCRQ